MQLQRNSHFVSSPDEGTDRSTNWRKTRGKESEERGCSVWVSSQFCLNELKNERTNGEISYRYLVCGRKCIPVFIFDDSNAFEDIVYVQQLYCLWY